ncbi:MAG: bifunctional homocysteine S-methyltransferase/methylenetetrahydrofolate reductase [Lentisphaeria bacterium]|nr:bifunctional homocysteine S-methyltransferase/methylenetetrahydrofolate reductase [Lentisphaeria bacterium]
MVKQSPFIELITSQPVVFDGAMGTVLYERGVFVNTCYDAVCLSRPDLVLEVHRSYVDAGARVIETNTFGANPVKLREHGLSEKLEEINRTAVTLAKEAAGDKAFTAGSVGPCLRPRQPWNPARADELFEAFAEQMRVLVDAGVDLLALETFCHLDELALACQAAGVFDVPLLASFTVGESGETIFGVPAARGVALLDTDANVDMIGLNCGTGPAPLFDVLESVIHLSPKPFVVMPNAGAPKEVDGRMMYMTSPEYFTSYARKYIHLGARGVGGCCGTTASHIAHMAKALNSLPAVPKRVDIRPYKERDVVVKVTPMAEKSKLAAGLAAGRMVTSVELLPPKSCDLSGILAKARFCLDHGVDAINIPDGPRASARVSPMITAIEIERQVGIETVLHYCCRDRNLIGMQSDLLGGNMAGLRNLLIITGDPPKLGDYPEATGVFDVDAIGLTRVAASLNHGYDVGGTAVNPPTSLLLGVGANPCAVCPETEMDRYARKIAAGAEFAITQPVFDPDALFRFLDEAERRGCRIPVIAGIWPLVSYKNAEFMRNEVPGVTVPDSVLARMGEARTKEDGIKTGIDIACDVRDAVADRVAGFQVSAPFGRVELALAVLGGGG